MFFLFFFFEKHQSVVIYTYIISVDTSASDNKEINKIISAKIDF